MADDLNQEDNSVNTDLTYDSGDENVSRNSKLVSWKDLFKVSLQEDGVSMTSSTNTDTTSRSRSGTPTNKMNRKKKQRRNKALKKLNFVNK